MKITRISIALGIAWVLLTSMAMAGSRAMVEKQIKELDVINKKAVHQAVVPRKNEVIRLQAHVFPMEGRIEIGKVYRSSVKTPSVSLLSSHPTLPDGRYKSFRSALLAYAKQPAYVGPSGNMTKDEDLIPFSAGLRRLMHKNR